MAKYRLIEGIDASGYYLEIQHYAMELSSRFGAPEWREVYRTSDVEDGKAKWELLKKLKSHYQVLEEIEI